MDILRGKTLLATFTCWKFVAKWQILKILYPLDICQIVLPKMTCFLQVSWLHAEAEIWLREGPSIRWQCPALLQLLANLQIYSPVLRQWGCTAVEGQVWMSSNWLQLNSLKAHHVFGSESVRLKLKKKMISDCNQSRIEFHSSWFVTWKCWSMAKYPWLAMWICCHGHGFVRFGQYVITRCSALQQPCIIPSSWCACIIAIW